MKYVKYILVNNFWCSVNKNHQVSNNMHPPFMNSTFIFLGIYIYFNYHPMFGNSKNSSLPNTTQPLTVSKSMEESAKKKISFGLPGFKGYKYFFLNPKLHFFWHFIPFLHSHLLLFRRISPWPIKKTEVLQRNVMFYPRV